LPKNIQLKKILPVTVILCVLLAACARIDVFEKNVSFREHRWPASERPSVSFNISDTASLYNVYIVFRHSDAYNFNNVWVRCTVSGPGNTGNKTQQYELSLATNKGWNVTGMDDIYEHRVLIQQKTKFSVPGEYRFTFEQVMREDPLENVLNVGLRIERANPEGSAATSP
jgi:gliding motility-associated lipoprotein GldH